MNQLSRHRRSAPFPLGLCLGLALAALPATADEGTVDYRHHVMEAVGGHMQSVADILRRKVPHTEHLALHASAMADLASIADTLFPPGSEGGEALPAIWEDPEDFAEKLDAFKVATAAFAEATASGGDVGSAFQSVGQSCKGCHDSYREE